MRCAILLFLSLLQLPAVETTADAVREAAARRAWSWFGLTLQQAELRAAERKIRLYAVHQDGSDTPTAGLPHASSVLVALRGGLVVEATVGEPPLQEGVRDPALVPLLGLPEAEALKRAKELGRPVRTLSRDGQSFPATMDYSETRLNLTVVGGLVVAISLG